MLNPKSKWHNYGLWTALASAVVAFTVAISTAFGFVLPATFESDFMGIVYSGLAILAVLGIVSNPKDGKWFKDKE
jgi:uncharacterized membrane protein